MKHVVVIGALLAAFGTNAGHAQQGSIRIFQARPNPVIGRVHLAKALLADGKPLPPGTYEVQLPNDQPPAAVGQSPEGEHYVEFVRDMQVRGREVATVISASDIGSIAKGRRPKANSSVVEMLKGGDYWRVWINKGGTNYIINMPAAK